MSTKVFEPCSPLSKRISKKKKKFKHLTRTYLMPHSLTQTLKSNPQTKTAFLTIFFQSLFKAGAVTFPFAAGGVFTPDSDDEELSLSLSELDALDEELSPPDAGGGEGVAFGGSGAALPVDNGAGEACAFGGGTGAVSFPFAAGGDAKAGGGTGFVSFPAVPFNAAGGGRAAEPGAVPFKTAAGLEVEFVIIVVLLIIVAVPLATLGNVVALVPWDRVTVEVIVFAGDETVCVTFWPDTS
jgi:hypothetical protein